MTRINRKAVLLAIAVFTLLVLTISTPQFAESANAIRKPDSIGIEIQSPLDNVTFNSSVFVALKVELVYGTQTNQYYTGLSKQDITCKYSLDNAEWTDMQFAGVTLNRTQWDLNFPFINLIDFSYNTTLQGLTAGTHSLNFTTAPFPQRFVFSYDADGHYKKMPSQVYFNVSASQTSSPTPSPSITEFPSLTILLLLTIMLATAGLLVYHKKIQTQLSKGSLTVFSQESCTRSLLSTNQP
jgi:hypothetical protein